MWGVESVSLECPPSTDHPGPLEMETSVITTTYPWLADRHAQEMIVETDTPSREALCLYAGMFL